MEEQISEQGQWPEEKPQRTPPTPPPIRPRSTELENESSDIPFEPMAASLPPILSAGFPRQSSGQAGQAPSINSSRQSFPQQSSGQAGQTGQEDLSPEPKVAPPPAPEIGMRTLESDVKSVKGGEPAPVPEAVLPSELKEVLEQPETIVQMEGPVEALPTKTGKALKVFFLIMGILILGGGLGVFGYYVVYPLIGQAPTAEIGQPPVNQAESIPLPVRLSHQSYFSSAVTKKSVNFNITLLNLSSITQALQEITSKYSQPSGAIQEIEISDLSGGQIYAKDFFSNLLRITDADKKIISEQLDPDFTAYLYYDDKGVWPGYILKIKSTESAAVLTSDFLPVVELLDVNGFYLISPGAFQAFRDGKAGNYTTRYALASQPGASFNYGIIGDYLIFSASYNGLKEAAAALGL